MSAYVFEEAPGADAVAPVLFVFHGTGGDEHQFFGLARQLVAGAQIVAPRGNVSENGAARYFRRTGEGVYDMADLAERTGAMIGFVRERIADRTPSAVLGLGYSNGANILASMMFEAPDLFDVAVLMHPLIPFEPPPRPGLAGRRVLVTAGRNDPICPPDATRSLAGYFTTQGAQATIAWHEGGHELRQEELLAAADFLKPYGIRTA